MSDRTSAHLDTVSTLDFDQDGRSHETMTMSTCQSMLAEVRKLAPEIVSRVKEIETLRHVPTDLVEALKAIGIFRMFVPESHGGMELDPPLALEIIRELTSIEGSLGWNAMIGSVGSIFVPLVPREIYDRVYENGPDTIIAGSIQPAGTAEKEGDQWRINGRWPFASGCMSADWMLAVCKMTDDGKALLGDDGLPIVRGFLLPSEDWEIEDTWHVAELKGTGSHHIKIAKKVLRTEQLFDLERGAACVNGPLYQAVLQLLPLVHAAFHVGMAEGAFNDLIQLVNSRHQQQRTVQPLRDSEIFQYELGRVSADLRAARAFFRDQVASHWHRALAGTLRDEALFIESTQTAIWVTSTCLRVVDACFALAGGAAVYDSSPLQRRLRDAHVAAQHAVARQQQYVAAGKAAFAEPCPQAHHRFISREAGSSA